MTSFQNLLDTYAVPDGSVIPREVTVCSNCGTTANRTQIRGGGSAKHLEFKPVFYLMTQRELDGVISRLQVVLDKYPLYRRVQDTGGPVWVLAETSDCEEHF